MQFLEVLDGEIAAQERILESHPAYIKLKALRATRALYVGNQVPDHVAVGVQRPTIDGVERRRAAPTAGKSLEAVNAAIDMLREHGAPMRTAQLLALIEQRGITFAGNAPQNILSSLLSRSPEVVSKGGHIGWALTEWDSAGGGNANDASPPAGVQPQSAPVKPGEEVAHDNMS